MNEAARPITMKSKISAEGGKNEKLKIKTRDAKKAIVLLSGGLDSATTLYWVKNKGYKPYCIIFDYGQRHRREIDSALKLVKRAHAVYTIVKISLPWKGSSLLDKKVKIPGYSQQALGRDYCAIPNTYVPARNTIFLSFALSYAEAEGIEFIFIGANAVDFSGYPDCRPRYYKVFNRLTQLATKAGCVGRKIKICTPLISKAKKDIIKEALKLKVPLKLTWSCYEGGRRPCGGCDSCVLRKKGFLALKTEDPAYD